MAPRRKQLDIAKDFVRNMEDRVGWFTVQETELKGRGVFASVDINAGDFLLEYGGELISGLEGERRELSIPSVFRFFFQHKEKTLCVDATKEVGANEKGVKLGRLVNHGSLNECNAKMKVVDVEGYKVALCLFAIKQIKKGEEILYDYGIKNLPWEVIILSY
ncbi:N-lysine methyltransferase KMT5A [Holothuria leucospilota]|uniref:N-lysine methyltransferase KMT5A n=1 Tax=Holothuria leucospilota TaxID=206669 RepID=A0A9Q1BX25_HOLLE|nr:N-lysine methyltransferase KMT5A [Holothuria leucospilota]